MEKVFKVNSVADYDTLRGVETRHPLVSVIDYEEDNVRILQEGLYNFGLYSVSLKGVACRELIYGRKKYDYQEGTMVFLAPGQVLNLKYPAKNLEAKGKILYFHPDLIHGTALGKHIKDYSFFSYDSNEALHLSDSEKKTIIECFNNIKEELNHAIDKHSRKLIVNNIEMLLNYCTRFYERQFITREHVNSDILSKFETLLNNYLNSDKPATIGFPMVSYFAEELHLSVKYFGDLIKKETGKTAQEYIQLTLIDVAKEKVRDTGKSIGEISDELGFKYQQHFTRLFKQHVGRTPSEYRMLN